jgi:hypothetical protein
MLERTLGRNTRAMRLSGDAEIARDIGCGNDCAAREVKCREWSEERRAGRYGISTVSALM